MAYPINKPEGEWMQILGPEKYYILREKGTERPFTGTYNLHFEKGTYCCAGCTEPLFESESKFDSHCGCQVLTMLFLEKLYIKMTQVMVCNV